MPRKPKVHPLRKYRLERGLTQKELAALLEVHYSNVTYWETGERLIGPLRAWKIQKKLGIPKEKIRPDIFGG